MTTAIRPDRWVNVDALNPGDAEHVAWRSYANKLIAKGLVTDAECAQLNTLAIGWGNVVGRDPHLSGQSPYTRHVEIGDGPHPTRWHRLRRWVARLVRWR